MQGFLKQGFLKRLSDFQLKKHPSSSLSSSSSSSCHYSSSPSSPPHPPGPQVGSTKQKKGEASTSSGTISSVFANCRFIVNGSVNVASAAAPAAPASLSPSSSSSLDVDSEDDRSKNNDDEKIDVTKDDDEQAQGIVPQSSKASNKTTKFSNPAKSQEKSVAAKRTFPMSWKRNFFGCSLEPVS